MRLAVTVFSFVVGCSFLVSGVTKVAGLSMHVENFARWGYPSSFMYVVAGVEVLGGLMVLMPKTRVMGATLLVCTMLGAILTHLRAEETYMLGPPVALLLLSLFIAWKHRANA